MAEKKLLIVLNTSQEYIKHTGEERNKFAPECTALFESISSTYIPLLEMLERLGADEVPVRFALVLTPVLCTLLEDSEIQKQYIEWLEKKIAFGEQELLQAGTDSALLAAISANLEKARHDKQKFEGYNCRLVRRFLDYKKKGMVELLATCGTDIFVPYYYDMPEIISAQVESGILAYRSFFGEIPDGFWLPELGYYDGVEKVLRAYGINYTIVGSGSFLFSEIQPACGIFKPARFANALVTFGKEPYSDSQIFGEEGFIHNPVYLNQNRDAGFSLPVERLSSFLQDGNARYAVGFKYWNKNSTSDEFYDSKKALDQATLDAEKFVQSKEELLAKAESLLTEEPVLSLTITMNITRLCARWAEAVSWLEQVVRKVNGSTLTLDVPEHLAKEPFSLQRIVPYYGAASGVGYGEDLLSSKNSWMMRYVRKASERMVDLSDRFPSDTGLKARLLNLGAKELMFAQSLGWARMIHSGISPEYAEMRFKQSINDFTNVFDALGSNTVSTEWLTTLELQHQIFPWMNYRIFSRKV